MYYSKLFGKTIKEIPAEADSISHQLLVRAGMIQQIGAGIYTYLPLGWRVLRKIEQIIREEMNRAGGQELMMPSLQPLELWEQSGRLPSFGKTAFSVKDRKEHKFILGPTHEEIITELARRNIQSYRDMPLMPYQIQNKFRDEPRPRGGLLRVREFIMKDLYSFDIDSAALDISYQKMVQAYKNLYSRCGLPAVMVEADSGAIGGKESREFMLLTNSGEDLIVYCENCGYAANLEKARGIKPKYSIDKQLPLEDISTPNVKTIEEVCNFTGVNKNQTLKAVLYSADDKLIFVVIRGDLDVNDIKLKNVIKCTELNLATDAEVEKAGIIAGAASPIGLKNIKIIADESIEMGGNFIAGANKPETHIRNVNYPRDFNVDIVADIASVSSEDKCINCGKGLKFERGIEVGHVFKLGTFLSEKLNAYYLDKDGNSRPIVMGCYGIGLGRLMAAAVEQNHDDKGIIWPNAISPFQIHICPLRLEDNLVSETTDKIYLDLVTAGYEVLLDDRGESAGIKFNDADLLGIPIRLTVSPRSLQKEMVELKLRKDKDIIMVTIEELKNKITQLLS